MNEAKLSLLVLVYHLYGSKLNVKTTPVDNTPIHSSDVVDPIILERRYSAELNPIEVF
ncbi:hypothetical protein RO3G_13056 [Rhizopus delemar RA 99-880]|uniref:Uncharacterized protein n=1 Tax=Rhizopus delemar (strain RA 99-880 / ATCC MYA-4621 / FGSC 9543 / NRRL 43880) TaxID=246409 RepID=I1CIR4_RHIO9|nr:hypothetical protein RO3G_13055 [Rhizopus delemar RA 99-880]EIE88345.1 hypothetical protein RO3G_13056 [Rhizopus delemar RA 99-880]|eukprot:EIE88344.1 hypothetical protein RO3G_13055 [Rhizopus delemar RA 99-880]